MARGPFTRPVPPVAAKPAATDWDTTEEPASPSLIRVRCIVHNKPHTHRGALEHGQEQDVPEDVADAMLNKGQVELV